MDFVTHFMENMTGKDLENLSTSGKIVDECVMAQFFETRCSLYAVEEGS